jgi:hypothetical protein
VQCDSARRRRHEMNLSVRGQRKAKVPYSSTRSLALCSIAGALFFGSSQDGLKASLGQCVVWSAVDHVPPANLRIGPDRQWTATSIIRSIRFLSMRSPQKEKHLRSLFLVSGTGFCAFSRLQNYINMIFFICRYFTVVFSSTFISTDFHLSQSSSITKPHTMP